MQSESHIGKHREPMTQNEFYANIEIWEDEFEDPSAKTAADEYTGDSDEVRDFLGHFEI